jgi:hypothetical protein
MKYYFCGDIIPLAMARVLLKSISTVVLLNNDYTVCRDAHVFLNLSSCDSVTRYIEWMDCQNPEMECRLITVNNNLLDYFSSI